MSKNKITIWLAYVGFPITTAIYLERSLRRHCNVVTIGPELSQKAITYLGIQNLKASKLLDIETSFTPDMKALWDACPAENRPDLYIWVQSLGGHEPQNLDAIPCPKACYVIDSHYNVAAAIEIAGKFDFVFLAQLADVDAVRMHNKQTYWLPLGCDPDIHEMIDVPKSYDLGFVGNMNPVREHLLTMLADTCHVHSEQSFFGDMARTFSASKIALNNASYDDLNMRFFEVLSMGSLLLSNKASGSGQDVMFRDGEDYALYDGTNIREVVRFYLDNESLREQIAHRGRQLALNAHTYDHRMRDMLAVALNGKPDTYSPEELRTQSLVGIPEPLNVARQQINVTTVPRSFVIPVLDYSPASEYNINTLLKDLEGIPGDVIIVFNSEQVADDLKHHPRINHYAVMKHNVGVARAWNIGLSIAETQAVFILNADLHLRPEAVSTMEHYLMKLDNAAIVGPQGSFVNFALGRDYYYYDKGTFDKPIAVDAVSGFLFCVNRHLLKDHGIHFENDFTPCYFEEWDLGLQLKRAGLASYVVPVDGYDHHWSGSIRALRTIPFYNREETAGEILLRNRRIFLSKWREIIRLEQDTSLFDSGWKQYALTQFNTFLQLGDLDVCTHFLERLILDYPNDQQVIDVCNKSATLLRMIRFNSAKQSVNNQLTQKVP